MKVGDKVRVMGGMPWGDEPAVVEPEIWELLGTQGSMAYLKRSGSDEQRSVPISEIRPVSAVDLLGNVIDD